jgi:phospholipid/cholesterol/gamma-HCH transport system ATP-binding protein
LLQQFGAQIYSVELIGIGVLRLFAVLITAVILAGRSASSFAAEIGAMKMNQEVDAMEVMGVDTFEALVLPRFIALLAMMPLLTFVAMIAGILGGMAVTWTVVGLAPPLFLQRLLDNVGVNQFWIGMVQAPVMAVVIAAIGCRQGLDDGGGSSPFRHHPDRRRLRVAVHGVGPVTALAPQAPNVATPIPQARGDHDGGQPVVEVRDLVSRFGSHVVHDGLNLTVRKGEVLGIVGGSGAGKSVLLNTIIGLKRPDGGGVKVFGIDIETANLAERKAIEARWGVLFQGGALFSSLSVRENVAAPLREHSRLSARFADELADLKIAMTGLPADAGDLRPAELSGGMRKRAGLARAIAMDPELLFLDEPTAGLDPIGAEAFDVLVRNLSQVLGLTILMITHDLDSLYAVCDRVAVIADQKIIAAAPIPELEKSNQPWIQEYFLGPRGRAAAGAAARSAGEA